ncbi:MAG: NADH-quinone oxidoreductase subunit NuoH [Chloroflexi bacterium]|nr:NADH-quinone oxidoreductase subunit NuoH [Chloroflexota bacterium]
MIVLARWWDLRSLANPVNGLLGWLKEQFPDWVAYVVSGAIGAAALGLFLGVAMLALIWVERRVIARIQIRQGPNRAGPQGILQPVADAIKLMQKEALTPLAGDKWIFWLAPLLLFIPTVLTLGVVPFGDKMTVADLNVGLLFIVAVGSGMPLIIFMAGWSSNNKYSLLGSMRTIAMVLSYELPAVVSLLSVVVLVGSMQLGQIVAFQQNYHVWNVFILPLPFAIYLIASLAEIGRSPYDIAEAESEIVAGYHTEYSGMKFGLFYAVELANALILGGIFATLFFGGWWTFGLNIVIPSWLLFFVKMMLGYWLFVWARGTVPRLRIDQSLKFSWQFLLPLGLINVVLVAFEVALWAETDAPGIILAAFAVVNWAMAAGLIVGYVKLLKLTGAQTPRKATLSSQVGIVNRVATPAGSNYSAVGS